MKIKELFFNKKKIASLLLAAGISLCHTSSLADIISYNKKVTLKNGKEVHLYFTTGNTDNDYSYVSFDNSLGYLSNSEVNYQEYDTNNYYQEMNEKRLVLQEGYLYQTPSYNATVMIGINRGEYVQVIARNSDGWCAVYNQNNFPGFIHESAFKEKANQILMAKIKGNNVNIRSSASTKYYWFCRYYRFL